MRRAAPLLILCLLAASGDPAAAGETACWFENGAVVAPAAVGGMAGDYVLDLSAPAPCCTRPRPSGRGMPRPPCRCRSCWPASGPRPRS
jgi:hypothetical protein